MIINKYIKIKCLRRNTLDIYKYNICIYDKCNKLVFKGVTNEIKNEDAMIRNFNLTDANYSGMKIEDGSITLMEQ